jgi:F-type H+-transporting ATPase subunit b
MRIGRLLLLVIGLAAASTWADNAVASDPATPKAAAQGHDADKHGDSHDGDSVNKILDLAIWTVVVFLLLLAVLHRYAWKPMLSGLQHREANIRSALDEAEKARAEAQALRSQFQVEMDKAQAKVNGIIDDAKRNAQAAADDLTTKARSEIAADRDRLRREIQVEVDQAMQMLWVKAATLATQASAKAIGKQLDVDQHRRLIDEAINEIRKAAV